MEKIDKRDGCFYYGDECCKSADAAYRRFKDDYHRDLGKQVYRRLERLGARTERIHGFGIDFTKEYSDELAAKYAEYGRVRCRIMGIVGISYCRMVGIWDLPDVPDDQFASYLDWLLDRRSHALYVVGRRAGSGRMDKRKKRYR